MRNLLIEDIGFPEKGNIGILIYADGSVEVCGSGPLSKPIYGVPLKKAIEISQEEKKKYLLGKKKYLLGKKKYLQGLFIEGLRFGILKKRSLFEADPEEYMTLRIFPDGRVYLCRCKGFEGLDIFDMVEHDKRAMFVR